MNLIHFKTIDSTNARALELLAAAQNVRELDQTVIAADEQSAGRGRLKRAFYSPAKTGIYFTAIYAPAAPIQDPAALTVAAAVAVCRSLKEFFDVDAKIKWVNDVYVAEKKVCGILAEGHLGANGKIDAAAIGIGINIYPNDFPAEIADRAGAVLGAKDSRVKRGNDSPRDVRLELARDGRVIVGRDPTILYDTPRDVRLDLARDVSQKLFDLLQSGADAWEAALAEYRERSFIIGKEITVIPIIGDERSAYPATVLGIDKEARLLVRLDDGSERALSSGEISIRL